MVLGNEQGLFIAEIQPTASVTIEIVTQYKMTLFGI